MEDWIRERGYVMWLGALGLAASREDEVREELERRPAGTETWRHDEDAARSEPDEVRATI